MASALSASLPDPPDSAGSAPASMHARLHAVDGGKLMLLAELEERPRAEDGYGVELQAVASAAAAAAAARAGDSLLLIILREERLIHASHLAFAEGPPSVEKEESLQDEEEAEPDEKLDTEQEGEQEDQVFAEEELRRADDLKRHLYSLKLRIWFNTFRLHLLLFDNQNWLLTREYSICSLSKNEMESLKRETKGIFSEDQSSVPTALRSDYEGIMVPSLKVAYFVESKLLPSLDNFRINQLLGKGASCNVFLGNCYYDQNNYAIKVMKLQKKIRDEPREITIQSCLKSAYVVSFSQAWIGSLCTLEYETCSESYSYQSSSEEPLPEEDPSGPIFKPISQLSQLEGYLVNNQSYSYCHHINGCMFIRNRNSSSKFDCDASSIGTEGTNAETCSASIPSDELSEDCEGGLEDMEPKCLCISMEFCPRMLSDYLSFGVHKCDVGRSKIIFQELTEGLKHIHDAGVVHRDLKPANIFFGLDGSVKIGDFGHSCLRPECLISFQGTPNRGTEFYSAPELATGLNTSDKCDIYSLGAIYLQLFSSFGTACELAHTFSSYCEAVDSEVKWEGNIALFKQMTSEDPRERPSADDILQDHIRKTFLVLSFMRDGGDGCGKRNLGNIPL